MLKINVALPNGHAELLTLLPSSTVQDVRAKAQQAFGKKHLRLITAKNRVLVHLEQSIEEAEIEDGECLTALVLQPQLTATGSAFALWCHGESAVVTWGQAICGGDSSAVQDQLKGVQQIQATAAAFAAILEDGSVVAWGHAQFGGDTSSVRDQLRGVQQIQATQHGAFAAILADGSVVTWGRADSGSDTSAVRDQLRGVQHIQASAKAFAAILKNGSVVTWGDASFGGDSSAVRDQLRGVMQIQATAFGTFAAILEDGSVVSWGRADFGGDSSAVRDQLRDVQQIQSTCTAFAAILEDGSVITWGGADHGGDSSAVRDQLRGVQQIQSTGQGAFAAILADGSVITWGRADSGGDSWAVRDQLKGVLQIQATSRAFAAILADGSVVTWGYASFGGDSSAVRDQLRGVQQIQATDHAFAAILADGSVVTWGHADFGGAKLVNLTNSSVAMTIPLESLDAQLSLCEDALTPLEGLQSRLSEAEAEAKRATAEAEQEQGGLRAKTERTRLRRAEVRLSKATEILQGLSLRLRSWLSKEAGGQDVEPEARKLPSRSLEQSLESCGELLTRLEAVQPQVVTRPVPSSDVWEPDSNHCNLCSAALGKRHLRPRHHCRFCGRKPFQKTLRTVVQKASTEDAENKHFREQLRTLAKKKQPGLIPEAFKLAPVDQNYRPIDRDYASWISQSGKTGFWQDAFALLGIMKTQGVPHSVFTYTAAISACEKGGQWQSALALFQTMPEEKVVPNVMSYSAIISACEKGGQWQRALFVFQTMPEAKVVQNVVSYSAIISACEKGGQWQRALALFQTMPEAKVVPNVFCYGAVMNALARDDQWQQSLAMLSLMVDSQVEGNIVTYNALFDCPSIRSSRLGTSLFQGLLPFLRDITVLEEPELDLHILSQGSTCLTLKWWLATTVQNMLLGKRSLTCRIVTGWGKTREAWGTSDLRATALEMLNNLGLQAKIDPKNPGCLLLFLRKLDLGTLQRLGRLWCL
eukprot:symbB.v1.2.039729.t2/scaffold6752.1/size15748/1